MTENITYAQVKQAIPNLSERELRDLLNRCKALLKAEPVTDNTDWLLEGFLTELRSQGIYIPAYSKIKTSSLFPSYAEKSEHMRNLLEQQGISTKTEKRQLSMICAKCLIEYLKSFTEVSLNTMMLHIDNLPQAIERAFPGYLNSNVLMFLVNRKTVH